MDHPFWTFLALFCGFLAGSAAYGWILERRREERRRPVYPIYRDYDDIICHEACADALPAEYEGFTFQRHVLQPDEYIYCAVCGAGRERNEEEQK